jgi:GNAT superfamily N-acetyltransferase
VIDPRHFSVDETLKNGVAVTIRHLRADDRTRVAKAISLLERETIYTRLFTYRELTESGLDRIMRVDPADEIALIVTTRSGSEEIVIGACRCIASGGDAGARTAEIAFTVEEDYQGQGIAGRLLRHLAALAPAIGVTTFEADVLAGNDSMLRVFTRSGLPMRKRNEGGTVHLTLLLRDPQPQ